MKVELEIRHQGCEIKVVQVNFMHFQVLFNGSCMHECVTLEAAKDEAAKYWSMLY